MEDLSGRVAVVTGAASGIGLAMAKRFGRHGMRLVLADIEQTRLDTVADELIATGLDVTTAVVDVADAAAVSGLADLSFERHGAVHVLCNNAGVNKRARSWDYTLDDWAWVMGVDFMGVVHGVRAFVPRMLGQDEAHIVNTASMAGLLPIPNLGAYAAAKSAVVGLSLSMALEFEQVGTAARVSVLCPGWIATGIADSARNRPASLSDVAAPPDVARTSAGLTATMTADDVASQVVDAVRTNRFWILTHQQYRPVIQQHAAAVGTDDPPRPAPIW